MHPCEKCSMISDEMAIRLDNYGNEMIRKFPENREQIYHEDVISQCWCEKTGYKLYATGLCEELAFNKFDKKGVSIQYIKPKQSNKHDRDKKYKRHLKFLAENISYYPSPAFPVAANGNYVDNSESHLFAYYKRRYQSNGKKSSANFFKKESNRKIRRYKGKIPNGRWCHKLFDFWWEIY